MSSAFACQLMVVGADQTVLREEVECNRDLGAEPQAAVQTPGRRQKAMVAFNLATCTLQPCRKHFYVCRRRAAFGAMQPIL
jgi:hypothetical protein